MTLWERVSDHIIEVEGGYVNHPTDPGGETNWGISKRSFPHLDIRNLTRAEAIEIYRQNYWAKIPTGIPDALRWMAFDAAVNHGTSRALAWLGQHDTVAAYTAARLEFYTALTTWPTFGKGWARRIANLIRAINVWASGPEQRHAETVVLHDFKKDPVILRGNFVWRNRDGKIDIRWADAPEETP